MDAIEPFRIAVADAVLDDLAARLERARVPSPPILDGGETAETIRRIEQLVAHWRGGYDWRAQERRLNAFPHYRAVVDGVGIHFIHVPGAGPDPLPLLLTNGWPSSFVEYLGVLDRLADPAAHGGDATDGFTVVVPALPGYGFSDRCLDRSVSRVWIAGLFNRLMVEHLGYRRYVAHGDDIGGGVVNRLGIHHADAVLAIQTANWLSPYVGADTASLNAAEQAYRAAEEQWDRTEGAYAHVQATRPQTLSYGLNDSPLGLAAWILEKFLTWSDPATRWRLSADDLLTTVMLYWATETIGSSVRLYALRSAPLGPHELVTAPTSVLAPHEPKLPVPPESWLHRAYPNLARFVTLDEGGHFLALESPARLVAEVREAFRPYRTSTS
ncbi:MAG TPA: epoxide hydrolase [Streptosporangiaceae bacterium]